MPYSQDILGPESPLKSVLPDFSPRTSQQLMAEACSDTLAANETLVIEAGTGTGKTFAYLAPAITSGLKTIVSTGTRALQDQLFHRDIPLLTQAIGAPVAIALLKGRSNYLCLHRLRLARHRSDSGRHAKDLERIERWAPQTRTGDKSEVTDVSETSGVWPWVTSTLENCVGQRCEFYEQCHVVTARRGAQGADIVVVNHYLLLADLAMKETGFDQFLPGCDAFVLDEAHQLPDIAGQFFGVSLSTRVLQTLLDEILVEAGAAGGRPLTKAVDACQTAVLKLRDAAPHEPGRYEFSAVEAAVARALAAIRRKLDAIYRAVQPLTELSAALDSVGIRLYDRLGELIQFVDDSGVEGLRWLEVGKHSVSLNLTPLDVSAITGSMMQGQDAAWIFTSATLAVGEDFSHFTDRLGLVGARAIKLESPYDLAGRSLIYLPPEMPPPSARNYTDEVMRAVKPLTSMTTGGVFVLFTSHRALRLAADWMKRRAGEFGRRQSLVQGEAPRDDLLKRFRAAGDAVLLATGTFWEGVDVRGKALTLVVIDKLPFASPGDPLVIARLEYLKRRGENGFMTHQLPHAVLSLKQGVGRLLRDDDDYGVIVLCDPRIGQKQYGRRFLDALEPMPVTDDPAAVEFFFQRFEQTPAAVVR